MFKFVYTLFRTVYLNVAFNGAVVYFIYTMKALKERGHILFKSVLGSSLGLHFILNRAVEAAPKTFSLNKPFNCQSDYWLFVRIQLQPSYRWWRDVVSIYCPPHTRYAILLRTGTVGPAYSVKKTLKSLHLDLPIHTLFLLPDRHTTTLRCLAK